MTLNNPVDYGQAAASYCERLRVKIFCRSVVCQKRKVHDAAAAVTSTLGAVSHGTLAGMLLSRLGKIISDRTETRAEMGLKA